MKIIRVLHTIYSFFVFVIFFLLLFPFFVVISFNRKWHHLAYKLDHLWSLIYFPICFFKTEIIIEAKLDNDSPVIYCANHFSPFDIPSLALLPKQACYVGKESIRKIPLFGYMFKTLHITIDRSSFRDRGLVYKKYISTLADGKSLFIYPEGGITSTDIPQQSTYKDGAFRVAIEQNIPIVPVTIPNNWKVLRDGGWLIEDNFIKLIVHEPIYTYDLTLEDSKALKNRVRNIIQSRIDLENNILP